MKRGVLISGLMALALAGTAVMGVAASDDRAGGKPGMGHRGAMLPFDEIDANGDGKITADEMRAHADQRFAAIDTNGDGVVDAAEIQAHMLARATERMQERSARMIARLDTDGDGALSRDEMRAGAKRGGDSEARFERMIKRFDTDGDGAISREEMDAARAAWAERGPRGAHQMHKAPKAD